MTVAIVIVVLLVVVVGAVKVAEHLKHPENIETTLPHASADGSTSDDLYGGSDRPAGPDAEDPPTLLPNQTDDPPAA